MCAREYIGIILFGIGILILPIGWMYSVDLTLLGAIAALLGIAIFATQKFMDKATKEMEEPHSKGKYAVPSDVNDHSGWGRGGRSSGWLSSDSRSDMEGD